MWKKWIKDRWDASAGLDKIVMAGFAAFTVIDLVSGDWIMAVVDVGVIGYVIWSVDQNR